MYLTAKGKTGRYRNTRRGLGLVSTMVNGSLVLGSSPIARTAVTRASVPRTVCPAWGCGAPPRIAVPIGTVPTPTPVTGLPTRRTNGGWGGGQYAPAGGGSTQSGDSGSSLAVAQALLQSNPNLLTAQQWTLLQQAGLVAGTVPYSSAGQVDTSTGAIDPATGQPYSAELAAAQAAAAVPGASSTDIGTMLQTNYGGLPLFAWLLIAGGGYLAFSGKRGR